MISRSLDFHGTRPSFRPVACCGGWQTWFCEEGGRSTGVSRLMSHDLLFEIRAQISNTKIFFFLIILSKWWWCTHPCLAWIPGVGWEVQVLLCWWFRAGAPGYERSPLSTWLLRSWAARCCHLCRSGAQGSLLSRDAHQSASISAGDTRKAVCTRGDKVESVWTCVCPRNLQQLQQVAPGAPAATGKTCIWERTAWLSRHSL